MKLIRDRRAGQFALYVVKIGHAGITSQRSQEEASEEQWRWAWCWDIRCKVKNLNPGYISLFDLHSNGQNIVPSFWYSSALNPLPTVERRCQDVGKLMSFVQLTAGEVSFNGHHRVVPGSFRRPICFILFMGNVILSFACVDLFGSKNIFFSLCLNLPHRTGRRHGGACAMMGGYFVVRDNSEA